MGDGVRQREGGLGGYEELVRINHLQCSEDSLSATLSSILMSKSFLFFFPQTILQSKFTQNTTEKNKVALLNACECC